jgi:Fur family peroxide stress response transcriptional regulator
VCLGCDKIIDPELTNFKDMTKKISGETGFEIITHRIDFFGICPECQKKNLENSKLNSRSLKAHSDHCDRS